MVDKRDDGESCDELEKIPQIKYLQTRQENSKHRNIKLFIQLGDGRLFCDEFIERNDEINQDRIRK